MISIILPIITTIGGVYLGHHLAMKQMNMQFKKQAEHELNTEQRIREEKFEDAIQFWGLLGNCKMVSTENGKSTDWSIYEKFYYTECHSDRKELYRWLKENEIKEASEFIKWLDKKIPQCQVKRFLEPFSK